MSGDPGEAMFGRRAAGRSWVRPDDAEKERVRALVEETKRRLRAAKVKTDDDGSDE